MRHALRTFAQATHWAETEHVKALLAHGADIDAVTTGTFYNMAASYDPGVPLPLFSPPPAAAAHPLHCRGRPSTRRPSH